MPRAYRHFIPGHIWHITHRCHQSQFLLKYAQDRERYLHWLFEARKRFGLCVLNYMVTRNHVHLLIKDTGGDAIASSLQLVAGRTGQEYNKRKERRGAFWEERYHATAIDSDQHLLRCITYIDLNMVRAGETPDADGWAHCGFHEIQGMRQRYAILDFETLVSLCGFTEAEDFRKAHRQWAADALLREHMERDRNWSDMIAVGSESFVSDVRKKLGLRPGRLAMDNDRDTHLLREEQQAYEVVTAHRGSTKKPDNTRPWR